MIHTHRFRYIGTLILFIALLGMHACIDDIIPGNDPETVTGAVAGTVLSSDGSALSGVSISTPDVTTTSGADGTFHLKEVEVNDHVVIRFSKNGYADNYKNVEVIENEISTVNAALSLIDVDMMIDVGQDNEIEFNGAKVKVPANGFVDPDGNPVTGNINALLTYFDPTDDQYYNVFPGSFVGISATGQEGLLESFGFINATFFQGGKELDLASQASAEITIPIPQSLAASAPNPVPLFYFDEDNGQWKEEGGAQIVDGKYVGTVAHFSNWNADRLYADETCIIKGRVVDQDGNPLWLARVYADGLDFVGSNYAISDLDGRFSMEIKSDSRVKVKAYWTSIIAGLWYGESAEIIIDNTCSPGGMKDIGDVVIPLDSSGPGGNEEDVWWDVFIKPYPTVNLAGSFTNFNELDAWRVGRGGKIEICKDCSLSSISWQALNSNTTQTILGIEFIDRDHGWICGNNGLVKKTSDRGRTWETVTLDISGNDMYEIEFTDEKHGFMAGTAGQVWTTTDGGLNWDRMTTNFVYDLWDLDFVNSQIGWVVGPVGRIFKTVNGGHTWSQQSSGVTLDLYGVSFVNKFFGWVVGRQGTVLYTEDGGDSWMPLSSGTTEDLLAVDFHHPNFGAVTGANGVVLVSYDRGNSWDISDIGDQELWCVDLYDFYGIFGGDELTNVLGDSELESVSGGWSQVASPASHDLNAIVFIDADTGYIAGDGGTLLKTIDAGLTWQNTNVPMTEDLSDLSIFGNAIYLCGGEESVHRSLDYGQTWQTLKSNPGSFWEFTKIQFTSEEKGFVLGYVGVEEFLTTTDYGSTWQAVPNLPAIGTNAYLYDFEFTSELVGFVAGYLINEDKGVLYKTEDGGINWSVIYELSPFGDVNNVSFKQLTFATGHAMYMVVGAMLYKSLDNGLSWDVVRTDAPSSMQFLDEQTAWGIGFWKFVGGGTTILFTDDGGQTWKQQGSISGAIQDLRDIYMINDDVGIAVGDNGQIYRTEKGGF